MKLSVIVPVYNMAADDKLKWCMDSLTGQTLFSEADEAMEIIAVDDASTDNSLQILHEYAERSPKRFRVIHSHENLHQGGAKNIGLSVASGEWIGFIDADDYVTRDYYEKLLSAAAREGADMAGCDHAIVHSHTWEAEEIVRDNLPEQGGVLTLEKKKSLLLEPGHLVTKIYRRHIIYGSDDVTPMPEEDALDADKRLRIFPEKIFYEDNAVAPLFMTRAAGYAYVQEPMYYYLQHGASTVHTITNRHLEDRMAAGRLMLQLMRDEGTYDTYATEMEFLFTTLFYVNTLFSAMPSASRVTNRYAFTKALGEEMNRTCPSFRENPYYQERIDAEEKKLIAMQMRSHAEFYLYYKLLWTYRRLRYKL